MINEFYSIRAVNFLARRFELKLFSYKIRMSPVQEDGAGAGGARLRVESR